MRTPRTDWYRKIVLAVVVTALVIGCLPPVPWPDIAYQHLPTLLALGIFVWLGVRQPLSNLSYSLLACFLLLHILGAHYLYSNVPYEAWSRALFGRGINETFGLTRNHYDRLVHLMFGVLCTPLAAELAVRYGGVRSRVWAAVVAIAVVALFAGVYEILEWVFTLLVSPDAAENYNGQQGDMFDAQKDQALSFVGSLIAGNWVAVRGCPGGDGSAPSGRAAVK
ncbi:MAG: DUF2238 domain-containing protein [Phycisphaerales bacterium]